MPTSHLVEPATRSGVKKSPAANLKIESRRHEAEPDRAKPGETSSPSAVFEHLPAEIGLISSFSRFSTVFVVCKPQTLEVNKNIFGFSRRPCRIFPAGLTLVGDASRKSRPGGNFGWPGNFV